MRGHLSGEGTEQTGSQAYVPPNEKDDKAINAAYNLLRGVSATEGMPDVVMPAFGGALSDADVARIAAYLRRTRTSLPPWPDLATKIAAIRRQSSATD